MRRYNGILWKIKEKAMMTENYADILRGSLDAVDYHQPVMTLLFLKRVKFCACIGLQ
jgi:hypothetical protein